MLDIERDLLADTFYQFDMAYSKGAPLFGKMFVDTKVPWLLDEPSEGKKKKTMVSSMVDMYKKHKGARKAKEPEE